MKGKYNPGVHSTLLAAVGVYILYIAWNLFDKYRNKAGEMDPTLNIIAIIIMTKKSRRYRKNALLIECQKTDTIDLEK